MLAFRFVCTIVFAAVALTGTTGAARTQPNDELKGLSQRVIAFYDAGKFAEAVPFQERYAHLIRERLGPEHAEYAQALNALSILYNRSGRSVDAELEPLHKRALAIKEKHLGPHHEDVAASLHNLADLYQNLGRYQEAQQLEKRALDIKEKTLGPNHAAFGQSLMVLAHIYGSLGRYEDAEPLIRRAVAIYEKAGVQYQRSLAGAFQAFAELRQIQGKHNEAEDLLQRAIGIEKTALGPDHPNLVNTYNALANLLDEQGRGGEAKEYLQRALEIAEKSLGREHPEALWSRVSLALREAEKYVLAPQLRRHRRRGKLGEGGAEAGEHEPAIHSDAVLRAKRLFADRDYPLHCPLGLGTAFGSIALQVPGWRVHRRRGYAHVPEKFRGSTRRA